WLARGAALAPRPPPARLRRDARRRTVLPGEGGRPAGHPPAQPAPRPSARIRGPRAGRDRLRPRPAAPGGRARGAPPRARARPPRSSARLAGDGGGRVPDAASVEEGQVALDRLALP